MDDKMEKTLSLERFMLLNEAQRLYLAYSLGGYLFKRSVSVGELPFIKMKDIYEVMKILYHEQDNPRILADLARRLSLMRRKVYDSKEWTG